MMYYLVYADGITLCKGSISYDGKVCYLESGKVRCIKCVPGFLKADYLNNLEIFIVCRVGSITLYRGGSITSYRVDYATAYKIDYVTIYRGDCITLCNGILSDD